MGFSNFAGNIVSLTLPNGNICSYVAQNGYIQKYYIEFSTQTAGTGHNSQISVLGDQAPAENYAVAACLEHNSDGTVARHIFYQDQNRNLLHFFDSATDDTKSYQATSVMVYDPLARGQRLGIAGVFDAADGDTCAILTGVDPYHANSLVCLTIPWVGFAQATWMEGLTKYPITDVFTTGSSLDVGHSSVQTALYIDLTDGWEYLLVTVNGLSGTNQIVQRIVYSYRNGLLMERITPAAGGYTCFTAPSVLYPRLRLRPDNSLSYIFFDSSRNVAISSFGVPDIRQNTPFPIISSSDRAHYPFPVMFQLCGKNTAIPFDLVFITGKLTTKKSASNPELTDASRQVFTGAVYWDNPSNSLVHTVEQSFWAQLTRSGLQAVPGLKQLLLGIIEGPPPIPNENLNMPGSYDSYTYMGQPGWGETDFSATNTDQTGETWTWSAGLVASAEYKTGGSVDVYAAKAEAYGTASLEIQAMYRGMHDEQSVHTYVNMISSRAQIATDSSGAYYVQPAGTLLLMTADYTGYAFEVLDTNGNRMEGSLAFSQIFPQGARIVAVPYYMPIAAGFPVPGDILSYSLPLDEKQAIDDGDVERLYDNQEAFTNSWGYNSKKLAQATRSKSTTTTNGFSLDVTAMVGVEGSIKFMGVTDSAKLKVGVKLGLTGQWSRAKTDSNTIGVQMELRGNPTAPNSYTYYVFDLYQLNSSNKWTQDLLANLVTPTFPSNPYLREQNQQIVDIIHPDSCPWKIVYALIPTEFHFNQPANEVFTHAKGLSATAVSKVMGAGATTSQHLLDLVKAAGGKPANNGPDGMSLAEAPALSDAIAYLKQNPADCQALAGALDLLHQQHLDSNGKATSTVA